MTPRDVLCRAKSRTPRSLWVPSNSEYCAIPRAQAKQDDCDCAADTKALEKAMAAVCQPTPARQGCTQSSTHTPHTHTHPRGRAPGRAASERTHASPTRGDKARGAPARPHSQPRTQTPARPARPPQLRARDTLTCNAGLGHPLHDRLHGAAQRGRRRAGTAAAPGRAAAAAAPRRQRPPAHGRCRCSPGTAALGDSMGQGQVRVQALGLPLIPLIPSSSYSSLSPSWRDLGVPSKKGICT